MSKIFEPDIPLEYFKQICRVCLSKGDNLISIHEVVFTHNHNAQGDIRETYLAQVFSKYCNILVQKDDLKPQNICGACVSTVAIAFNILELCQLSNTRLETLLGQHTLEISRQNEQTRHMPDSLFPAPTDIKKIILRSHQTNSLRSVDSDLPPDHPIIIDESDEIEDKPKVLFDETQQNKLKNLECKSSLNTLPANVENDESKENKENLRNDMRTEKEPEGDEIDQKLSLMFADAGPSIKAEDGMILVISDSEDNSNRLDTSEHKGEDVNDLEEYMELQGGQETELVVGERHLKPRRLKVPSTIVTPPKTGREKWDHTYYIAEPKFLKILHQNIKRKMSKPPRLRRVGEFRRKELQVQYQHENAVFNCRFCEGTVLQGMEKVIEHMQSDHPDDDECLLCPRKFSNPKLLIVHVAAHANKKDLVCIKCLMYFKDKEALKEHNAVIDHENFVLTCEFCNKDFRDVLKLRSHIQEVHLNKGQLRIQCSECGILLKHKSNLQKHLRTHKALEDRKTFLCEHCAKGFTTSTALKNHVLIYHEGQVHLRNRWRDPIKVKEARKRFNEKRQALKKTSNEVTVYCCEYCLKIFSSKGAFFKHRISHPECQNVVCPFCDKVFDSSGDYKHHRIADHSDFMCELCNKGWPTKERLAHHKYNTHRALTHKCSFCPAVFKNQQHLTIHENTHKKVKRYSCQYCDKKFAQNNHVVQHEVSVHTKEKRYQCHICDKAFVYNSTLKAHIRTHVGYKPFTCPYCGKTFTDTVGRHRHVKNFHPERMDDFTVFKKENQTIEASLADFVAESPEPVKSVSEARVVNIQSPELNSDDSESIEEEEYEGYEALEDFEDSIDYKG